jgi:hypothetical protein
VIFARVLVTTRHLRTPLDMNPKDAVAVLAFAVALHFFAADAAKPSTDTHASERVVQQDVLSLVPEWELDDLQGPTETAALGAVTSGALYRGRDERLPESLPW